MANRVIVTGDKMLAATLHNAARQLVNMTSTHAQAGEVVRARAASNAPKRSGRLAGSVRASASSDEVEVSSSVVYARRVNYGMPSVGQAAQPFMTNALRDTEREVVGRYAKATGQAVAQVKGA